MIYLYNLITLCFFGTTSVQCIEHTLNHGSDKTHLRNEDYILKYDLRADLRLHRFTHGDVIYVYGTSTSGKTTFARKLADLLPEHTLVSMGDLKTKYMAKIINEVCPEEYTFVSKFISIHTVLIYLFEGILSIQDNSLVNRKYGEIIDNLDKIKAKDDHPMSKSTWEKIIDILDSNFGTKSTMKIESKYPYCKLLDTSKNTPNGLAVKIMAIALNSSRESSHPPVTQEAALLDLKNLI